MDQAQILDFSHNTLGSGIFFLKKDFIQLAYYNYGISSSDKYHFCASYPSSESKIKNFAVNLINNAKRRIFIASFRIGDPQILQALYDAVQRLKGGVYVITALDEKSFARGLQELDDEEESVDLEEQKLQFSELTKRGIYVRGHENCHAKFVLVDDNAALVGSANLVKNSFNKNGEANVFVEDSQQVEQLAHLFSRMWFQECTWEMKPGETYTVTQRQKTQPPYKLNIQNPESNSPSFIWTSGTNETFILQEMSRIIQLAKKELLIATYSIINSPELDEFIVEPIKKAIERGVRVRLMVRGRNHVTPQRLILERLFDLGAEIYGDTRNHAKGIIADGEIGSLYSANLDMNHGLTSGVEVGFRFDHTVCLQDFYKFLEHTIQNVNLEYARNPILQKLNATPIVKWLSPWPYADENVVYTNTKLWNELYTASNGDLVLFQNSDEWDSVKIYSGNKSFILKKEDTFLLLQDSRNEVQSALEKFNQWLSKPVSNGRSTKSSDAIGICPCKFIFADSVRT